MKNDKKKKKLDIYSRSKFFLNLRRRCQNKQIKVEERKADLIIDKILGRDKVLNRDYSVFVYNYPAPLSSSLNKVNNNINPNIESPSENSYSLRYKRKEIQNNSFANISINKNKKVNNTYSNIKQIKKVHKNNIETEENKLTGFRGDVNSNKNKINDKTLITGEYFNINKY